MFRPFSYLVQVDVFLLVRHLLRNFLLLCPSLPGRLEHRTLEGHLPVPTVVRPFDERIYPGLRCLIGVAGWSTVAAVGRSVGWSFGNSVVCWVVFGWSVGWLILWLVDRVDSSAGWLVGLLGGRSVGRLVSWLVCWLVGWLIRIVGWMVG